MCPPSPASCHFDQAAAILQSIPPAYPAWCPSCPDHCWCHRAVCLLDNWLNSAGACCVCCVCCVLSAWQALCNSGVVYREMEQLEAAVAAYEAALAVRNAASRGRRKTGRVVWLVPWCNPFERVGSGGIAAHDSMTAAGSIISSSRANFAALLRVGVCTVRW